MSLLRFSLPERKLVMSYGILYERIKSLAFKIYEERTRSGAPGDALSDWLIAERDLYAVWRVSITLGICNCSANRYRKTFEKRIFMIRNVPCAFETVLIDQHDQQNLRARHGCHAFLDEHGMLYADLMQSSAQDDGRVQSTGQLILCKTTNSRISTDVGIVYWFVNSLSIMTRDMNDTDFRAWLSIVPAV